MRETVTFVMAFLVASVLDVAVNAAAGAAAVATGARVNGSRTTSHALEAGAAAAAIKSTVVVSLSVICFTRIGDRAPWLVLIIMVSATLGIPVAITIAVCHIVLEDGTWLVEYGLTTNLTTAAAPRELLLAAVVAALPLWVGEGALVYHNMQRLAALLADGPSMRSPILETMSPLFLVAWDALAGYTFAKMAQNQGVEICEPKSAAAAGAVYGVVCRLSMLLNTAALQSAALHL